MVVARKVEPSPDGIAAVCHWLCQSLPAGDTPAKTNGGSLLLAVTSRWRRRPLGHKSRGPAAMAPRPMVRRIPCQHVRSQSPGMPYLPSGPGEPVLPSAWAGRSMAPAGPPPFVGAGTPRDAQLCEGAQILARAGS